jgi:hypothetical protein
MISFYNALTVLDVSMSSIFKTLKILVITISIIIVWMILYLIRNFLRPRFSAVAALSCPDGGTLALGHLADMNTPGCMGDEWHREMVQKYGHVFRYKIGLGVRNNR